MHQEKKKKSCAVISWWLFMWIHNVIENWIRKRSMWACWESEMVTCSVLSVTRDKMLWDGDQVGSEFQAGDYGSLCREGGISAEPGRMRSIRRCGIKKKDILKGNGPNTDEEVWTGEDGQGTATSSISPGWGRIEDANVWNILPLW